LLEVFGAMRFVNGSTLRTKPFTRRADLGGYVVVRRGSARPARCAYRLAAASGSPERARSARGDGRGDARGERPQSVQSGSEVSPTPGVGSILRSLPSGSMMTR